METEANGGVYQQHEDIKILEVYKKVRNLLKNLTPEKLGTLVSQFQALSIDTKERLQGVINRIIEKAVEPDFPEAYANMCKDLSMSIQAQAERRNKDVPECNFRKLLVLRWQVEFGKTSKVELDRGAKLRNIEGTTDPEKEK
jgi:hypothetical protein